MTRGPVDGVRQVVTFNREAYAGAALVTLAGLLSRRRAGRLLALAVGGQSLVSLAASWWVYDHSRLYRWDWLPSLVPGLVLAYANVSTGFDESSRALAQMWPGAMAFARDLHDPALTPARSIRRARQLHLPAPDIEPATPADLGLPTGLDALLLLFSAHELRRPQERAQLFASAAAALRPGGRLVVAEHARDLANAVVYGPGAWHFQRRREWDRCAELAGLRPAARMPITAFVRADAWEKP